MEGVVCKVLNGAMPGSQVDNKKELYDTAFSKVCHSVVLISRLKQRSARGRTTTYGMGFIFRSNENVTIVAVHRRNIKEDENIMVKFFDGSTCQSKDVEIIGKTQEFCFLRLQNEAITGASPGWQATCVSWNEECLTDKQEVFTILPISGCFSMFASKLISPSCITEMKGSKDTFSFRCPLTLTLYESDKDIEKRKRNLDRVSGAAIFNMEGQAVGAIDACSPSYTMKYGKRSSTFLAKMNEWLEVHDWKKGPVVEHATSAASGIALSIDFGKFFHKEKQR